MPYSFHLHTLRVGIYYDVSEKRASVVDVQPSPGGLNQCHWREFPGSLAGLTQLDFLFECFVHSGPPYKTSGETLHFRDARVSFMKFLSPFLEVG